ncbi:lipase 1 [Fopius arisanus]|uniref:Lipase n=1 Tax=Fopius arisanus TaxID=64838 RepID=A0A0C9QLR9_9HYME|nr:PREDICTED: lipase 1-like [Fopius arisanus]
MRITGFSWNPVFLLTTFLVIVSASLTNKTLFGIDLKDLPNSFLGKLAILNAVPYDPNTVLTTPQMIRRAGYPAESHIVRTADGYLLEMHRIPNESGYPIFLQHGLWCSSADWITQGKGKALAYLLADLGFDVWLGNYRGNTYSTAHVILNPANPLFWNFSWHDMGIYDLPSMITYVTDIKKQPVIYIGHSMGTTALFVMAAKCPDMHSKIRFMFGYAPVGFNSHWKTPLRDLASYSKLLASWGDTFGYGPILTRDAEIDPFISLLCNPSKLGEAECETFVFQLFGSDYTQLEPDWIPNMMAHMPAGSSTKTVNHYLQIFESKQFQEYDHGPTKNLQLYYSVLPPAYDLTKITLPIFFFYGLNDVAAPPEDVTAFYALLPNGKGISAVNYTQFSHLDFLWAKDAKPLVYDQTISMIQKIVAEGANN